MSLLTLGDRIRKRRLDLGLLQEEVAERLGVCEATVWHWELNRNQPGIRHRPAIHLFLGDEAAGGEADHPFGECLRQARFGMGWTSKVMAAQLGIDQSTVSAWELGNHRPTRLKLGCVARRLAHLTKAKPGHAPLQGLLDRINTLLKPC